MPDDTPDIPELPVEVPADKPLVQATKVPPAPTPTTMKTESDVPADKVATPLVEVPKTVLPVELTWNVIEGPTQQILNTKPLSETEAHELAKQLQESSPARPLVIRSNRAILQE